MASGKLTIVHPCGASHEVTLAAIDERKMRARIIWPMAGGYDVDLSNGYLRDKKARLWHLTEESLRHVLSIAATQSQEKSEKTKSH
jgi:hypothetical protein